MRYFRRKEFGEPEEITLDQFVQGIKNEFMFGKNYYEQMLISLGTGSKMIGSIHMYWVDVDA